MIISRTMDQIVADVKDNELLAIEELLKFVPLNVLLSYLSERNEKL